VNSSTEIITAPQCKSDNNKHTLDDYPSPYIAICTVCGEKFVLVAETVLEKLGIEVIPRQVLKS